MEKKFIGIFIVGLFIGTSIIPGFGQDTQKNLSDITPFSLNSSAPIGNIFECSSNRTTVVLKEPSDQTYHQQEWIKYNDGHTENAIGVPGTICEAIQLTDTELANYRGFSIWAIKVSIGSDDYGPYPGISYQVWIQNNQPADPTTANIIATGTSTSDVWEYIWITPYKIYATGDVWIGVNYINQSSGDYPMGVDTTTTSPTRGGYIWASGYGWTTLSGEGYEGVWGLDAGVYPCCGPPYTPSNPTPSNHATDVDINADLSWTGGDPDGDTVTYDVYFEAGDPTPDELVSYHQTGVTYDPGTMNANTKYYWQIVAIDNYGYTSTGPIWDFTTGSGGNNPPDTPTYIYPSNYNTEVDVNDSLYWMCSDPDGDNLTYDVYFGKSSNPPLVSKDKTQRFYTPLDMMYNTKYYWKIVSEDEHGASATGPIWDFTTSSEPNNPPYQPSNPYPENGSINIATNIILNWTGGDPDDSDTITYDVYFGGMLPIQKIASNISNTSINPGNLVKGLTYFWNVVAWDNHNTSTIGPGWYFTTTNTTNHPPDKPTRPNGPTKGKVGREYPYTTTCFDEDDDHMWFIWDWGDGNYSDWMGPYNSRSLVEANHTWYEKNNYEIRVKARDEHGLESDWSDPLAIRMPKTYTYNLIIQLIMKILERFPLLERILNQYYN